MVVARLWNPWLTTRQRPAVVIDDVTWTFGDVVEAAEDVQRGLTQAGVAKGSVVGCDITSGPELFALILAALRGGHGVFPVSAGTDPGLRADLLREAGAVVDVVSRVGDVETAVPRAEFGRLRVSGPPPPVADRAGFLVYATSGTTGRPAVVAHRQRWYPYRGVAVRPQYAAGVDRGPHVMANPAFHLGTLGPALYALQAGSAVVVMRSWSAAGFRDVVDAHAADSTFLTPELLAELVAEDKTPRHRLRCVLHGGSAMPPATKRRAVELFGPVLHEFYGTSHGVVTEVDTAQWIRRPGTVGRPLPGVTVSIRRGGEPVAAGEVGRVCVRFRAVDGADALGDTGDIGYVDDEGFLFLLGRGDEDAIDLARLEHLVHGVDGVVDAAVLRTPQGARCFVETIEPSSGVLAAVDAVVERTATERLVVVAGAAGTFPRTASGKLHRRVLAAGDAG